MEQEAAIIQEKDMVLTVDKQRQELIDAMRDWVVVNSKEREEEIAVEEAFKTGSLTDQRRRELSAVASTKERLMNKPIDPLFELLNYCNESQKIRPHMEKTSNIQHEMTTTEFKALDAAKLLVQRSDHVDVRTPECDAIMKFMGSVSMARQLTGTSSEN
eukprot:GHVT01008593.1.p2 GENE.GHVT01008593.1~~GHVT01008593.1.p2  ORF type:complete len:159 (-),score=16.00 GHVT01008593.1:2226-2702(-)